MKNLRYIFFLIAGMAALVSCEKDDGKDPGKPLLEPGTIASSAYFADSIKFSASVSDAGNIPLSTLKAQLFYGEEMVDEAVVRTKEYGQYEGKVFAPFHANIPQPKPP